MGRGKPIELSFFVSLTSVQFKTNLPKLLLLLLLLQLVFYLILTFPNFASQLMSTIQ